ncbi:hypothetical protein D3C80_1859900 [compost metagenome]
MLQFTLWLLRLIVILRANRLPLDRLHVQMKLIHVLIDFELQLAEHFDLHLINPVFCAKG